MLILISQKKLPRHPTFKSYSTYCLGFITRDFTEVEFHLVIAFDEEHIFSSLRRNEIARAPHVEIILVSGD